MSIDGTHWLACQRVIWPSLCREASSEVTFSMQADLLCSICLLLLYLAAALVPGLAILSLVPLHHGLAACLAAAPIVLLHLRPAW